MTYGAYIFPSIPQLGSRQRLVLRGTPLPPPAASLRWAGPLGPWPPRRWRAAHCGARGSEAEAKSWESDGKCGKIQGETMEIQFFSWKKDGKNSGMIRYDDNWLINGEGTMSAATKNKD